MISDSRSVAQDTLPDEMSVAFDHAFSEQFAVPHDQCSIAHDSRRPDEHRCTHQCGFGHETTTVRVWSVNNTVNTNDRPRDQSGRDRWYLF